MLEVHQLSREYGSFRAVDNVSFTIGKGEIVGLLGHNGAGKTTIMKMLSGYLEANHGAVSIDGIDLQYEPKEIQKNLGYLPESLPVYAEMTVADYLDFAADLKGLNNNAKNTEIKRVVQATDIATKLLAPISTLSRGLKQRVGVAQAILGRPKLLILDEPTNGLDPEQTQHMRNLIKDIAQDATVILSTHIMQEVEALCSRVLMLHGGKLALDAQLESLRQGNHILIETSLKPAATKVLTDLAAVEELEVLRSQNDIHKYRISFKPEANLPDVCAAIASCVSEQKAALYLLQPELRDLETLFKQVNEGQYDIEEDRNVV